ncbi:MAG TPA: hypothetical protein EYQ27_12440, partial [Gemmatimonadetes bacterium]|nr:hypothetical protein [Gemmatimonadota bacterium]
MPTPSSAQSIAEPAPPARLRRAASAGRRVWEGACRGVPDSDVPAFLVESADALRAVATEQDVSGQVETFGSQFEDEVFASEARVPLTAIRTGSVDGGAVDRIIQLQDRMANKALRLLYRPCATPKDIRAEALSARTAWGRLDLIVVDYLQLMRADTVRSNREQITADKSQALKALAGELNVPLIALAQLSRDSADLRESGAIEQDADGVILIHRPGGKGDPRAEFILAKQRNGPTCDIPMLMNGRY